MLRAIRDCENCMTKPRRIAIVGAGPIGLEAALAARARGFDVQIYERGRIAEHVAQWGHVTLFSPFGINSTELGRSPLATDCPLSDYAIVTGREYREQYLLPLGQLLKQQGRLFENAEVVSIARDGLLKGEAVGQQQRADVRFRLLVRERDPRTQTVRERDEFADVVLDCSGTWGQHRRLGIGGAPAIGEMSALQPSNYILPDILGADREQFADRDTVVIGSGYSAATAVVALGELSREHPDTRVVWLTRTERDPPLNVVENDSLPERAELVKSANHLARFGKPVFTQSGGSKVHEVVRKDTGGWRLTVSVNSDVKKISIDCTNLLALVGYRPDSCIHEELQVHQCYASEGPMKLAASLMGETSADCMQQAAPASGVLNNPEPNFYILGAKSYGRDSRFLIRVGLQQIEQVMQQLGNSTD